MNVVFFVHSLISDWNHGNAHFLRGLARALRNRGHSVLSCERWRNWSTDQLVHDHGAAPVVEFARRFPDLDVAVYGEWDRILDEVEELTRGADVVVVHEFNEPELVGAVSQVRRRRADFALLFHDTHHRAATAPHQITRFNLEHFDGILAFGEALATLYRTELGRDRVRVLHEAADITVFRPLKAEKQDDVVWIGNWGDEERTGEIRDYFIGVAKRLPELRFAAHGVRYPESGRRAMAKAGIDFRGWISNFRVPEAFARARMTIHIPRGPYLARLPGVPTIRPFEALACGIPLVMTAWDDRERLFRPGRDFLVVDSPAAMCREVRRLSRDEDARRELAEHGRATILARHTCDHRAEQFEAIVAELSVGV